MSEVLTAEDFHPHVARVFHVQGGDHALTLDAVRMYPMPEAAAKDLPRQPFTLIFKGPPGNVLPEGTYMLDVDGGPSFELYVIPIHTPARDRQHYQAAFN